MILNVIFKVFLRKRREIGAIVPIWPSLMFHFRSIGTAWNMEHNLGNRSLRSFEHELQRHFRSKKGHLQTIESSLIHTKYGRGSLTKRRRHFGRLLISFWPYHSSKLECPCWLRQHFVLTPISSPLGQNSPRGFVTYQDLPRATTTVAISKLERNS